MRCVFAFFLIVQVFFFNGTAFGQTHFDEIPKSSRGMQTGPEVGSKIPEFSLPDQSGTMRDFSSIAGPKGALILFYRSADW